MSFDSKDSNIIQELPADLSYNVYAYRAFKESGYSIYHDTVSDRYSIVDDLFSFTILNDLSDFEVIQFFERYSENWVNMPF